MAIDRDGDGYAKLVISHVDKRVVENKMYAVKQFSEHTQGPNPCCVDVPELACEGALSWVDYTKHQKM